MATVTTPKYSPISKAHYVGITLREMPYSQSTMIKGLKSALEANRISGGPELVEFSFNTSHGPITCLAEMVVDGPCIRFDSVCIYPDIEGAIEKGAVLKDILLQKSSLLDAVSRLGFSSLEINGKRVQGSSSAKPGRVAKIAKRLKPP